MTDSIYALGSSGSAANLVASYEWMELVIEVGDQQLVGIR